MLRFHDHDRVHLSLAGYEKLLRFIMFYERLVKTTRSFRKYEN